VEDAEDVRIFGHGTLDARGFALAGEAATIEEVRLKARCLTVERSRRVTVEGPVCRESTSWSVPFFHSTDVAARRIKVINDLGPLEHSDGINLCAVRNGVVEDCFVHTTDDAFCAKGHEGGPSENLIFRRLVALSATRGLKCGLQAYEPMRNVLFEQVDIVRTRDGIDLMHWDGAGEWSDITFRDVRVEQCERRSITATVREGGSIRDVRFDRISFSQARPGFLRGENAANRIEGVTFTDLVMGGERIASLSASGIKANEFVGDIQFLDPRPQAE
jgi:polygalacturonase